MADPAQFAVTLRKPSKGTRLGVVLYSEQNELNKTAWNNRSSINTNTVNNGGQYASNGKPGQGTGAGNMY